jgi:hypothetical protein
MTKYVERGGRWVEVEKKTTSGHHILRDIKPYKSMIDGSVIGSRSTHRHHLRQHECVEVGNEKLKPLQVKDANPGGRKDFIIRQFKDMSHKEFKKVMKRSVEKVRGY